MPTTISTRACHVQYTDSTRADGVPPLENLQLSYVNKVGYANMRCTWVLGCPNEIKPAKSITKLEAALEPGNERANTEAAYARAFTELFPGMEVPDEVGIHCGAQFALARWKVLERPKQDYERYRDWLWNTPLHDSVSGRILEYSWHSESRLYTIYYQRFRTRR